MKEKAGFKYFWMNGPFHRQTILMHSVNMKTHEMNEALQSFLCESNKNCISNIYSRTNEHMVEEASFFPYTDTGPLLSLKLQVVLNEQLWFSVQWCVRYCWLRTPLSTGDSSSPVSAGRRTQRIAVLCCPVKTKSSMYANIETTKYAFVLGWIL